jgi:hypothetical protein
MDYVGTKSTHLDLIHDLNQYVNGVKPYSNFAYLEYQQSLGNARRAALTSRNELLPAICMNFPSEKANHSFRRGLGAALLGGWRTAGVYTFSSGLPFTVSSGSSFSNALDAYGAATALPNVVGTPHIVGNTNCWFYVSANKTCQAVAPGYADVFALQQPGQFGNAGANILRGPHASVFDLSLMRDFTIRESTSLQFRWESFNLTSTPMFSGPKSNLSSGGVGGITSLAGDPRVMQFALRLSF